MELNGNWSHEREKDHVGVYEEQEEKKGSAENPWSTTTQRQSKDLELQLERRKSRMQDTMGLKEYFKKRDIIVKCYGELE